MDRKGFGRYRLGSQWILILGICINANAQNLVPNPSFEENNGCPFVVGQLELALDWTSLSGSPDYHHECGTNGFGIPANRGGWESANSGQAYVLQALWFKNLSNEREFIGVELSEPLQFGISYRVEFFLSMADSVWYAVANVGAHFSTVPHPQNSSALLQLIPQVAYAGDLVISEKEGWVKISGSFVAQGGERYLAIGNFDTDAETDTAFVPGGGSLVGHSEGHWDVAGYFIDDVSVIPDSIYLGTQELERELGFGLYPNPATDIVYLDFGGRIGDVRELKVVDVIGRVLRYTATLGRDGTQDARIGDVMGRDCFSRSSFALTDRPMDVSAWPNGVYLIRVTDVDGNRYSERLVVRH